MEPASDPDPNPNDLTMEAPPPLLDDLPSADHPLWDWGDLLDFTLDDHDLNQDQHQDQDQDQDQGPFPSPPPPPVPDRVRKRDPRLSCSNFIAGRVPCACPELDAMLAAEEEAEAEGVHGKKRVRVSRSGARCQVPGCEVDISELKGYHKRHRVCLSCANAVSVVLDGETKRYCQQCGKFHVLPDFDEGRRSCRRKLERHNNRRRRKPQDSRAVVDREVEEEFQTEETTFDAEIGKESLQSSKQMVAEKEVFVESEDGHISALHPDPNSQNINSDSGLSFGASGDTQMEGGKEDSKFSLSPSYCDNKTTYSSTCPTGRISFKLYDWNPAEFPRRLRLQIFQWLASMPVELEGYIRPGCTILTVFIAMPISMWVKLLEEPMSYIHDLVIAPGKMLSGRGPVLIYLNNMIFQVMKDGSSLIKVDVKERAPRLHYVYPTCFEAGQSMEFVACGSNLLQRKFRFLISFGGQYLKCDSCVALPCDDAEGFSTAEHQLYQISIPHIEPDHFGPAFIEVENESGLSNFFPVLIGDREVCGEMRTIQKAFDVLDLPNSTQCEVFASCQMSYSELMADIAWLLKKPSPENLKHLISSPQIQRITSLFNLLRCHGSTAILHRIIRNLEIMMDETDLHSAMDGTSNSELWILRNYVKHARKALYQKFNENEVPVLHSQCNLQERGCCPGSCCTKGGFESVAPSKNQKAKETSIEGLEDGRSLTGESDKVPLLRTEVVMNMNLVKERGTKSCSRSLSIRNWSSRPTFAVIAVLAICFGVCAAVLHPNKVSQFAVTIRRCLTKT